MKLYGSRIFLRAVEPSDVDAIYLFENSPETVPTALNSAPVSRHQVWEYVQGYDSDIFSCGELRLMIASVETEESVGCIDIADFNAVDRRGFVGIYIAERFRGRGYAGEALSLLTEYAADTLGLHQLLALIASDNKTSLSLFRSHGFKTCGCLRSWQRRGRSYCDVIICQRLFS